MKYFLLSIISFIMKVLMFLWKILLFYVLFQLSLVAFPLFGNLVFWFLQSYSITLYKIIMFFLTNYLILIIISLFFFKNNKQITYFIWVAIAYFLTILPIIYQGRYIARWMEIDNLYYHSIVLIWPIIILIITFFLTNRKQFVSSI